jgi:BRCT domain type II-containing protein
MTFDRIREAQKNINEILPNKPEYVVNTSEFNEMRARMIALHRRLKKEAADSSKPTLRQAPGSQPKTKTAPTNRPSSSASLPKTSCKYRLELRNPHVL